MTQRPHQPSAFWMIVLGLAALLWAAPTGLRHLMLTSFPTRIYYCLLLVGGIALVLGGAWLLLVRKVERGALFAVGIAALLLTINQATGLVFNTILCYSAG